MFSTTHLHPMLVHFPIALVAVGFLVEFVFLSVKKDICLTKMGFYLLALGTIGACASWFTGNFFTSEMTGAAGEVKEIHELLATVTVTLLIATLVLRTTILYLKKENSNLKVAAFILYGLAALAVSATGFYGGNLVYGYMMPL
jgi:uncharacterized membrane protein